MRPDLILLDLNLPRRDGREVLAEIKKDEDLRRIPVVVLTTSAADEDILRSYQLHANAYVTKPVDFERFIAVVRQIDEFFVSVVKLPPACLIRSADLIREVAATVVLPRFRHLRDGEVHAEVARATWSPSPTRRPSGRSPLGLTALLPGSRGGRRGGGRGRPGVLRRVGDRGAVWIVDPVDGTNNFAAGKTPFAVMVALLRDGEPAASWILDVVDDRMTVAEAGSGAYLDGVRVKTRTDDPGAAGAARRGGAAATCRPTCGPRSRANAHRLGAVTAGQHCAGYEYPAVATDEQQFALFWRILPWDHVPGSLILREAGGTVLHLDGTDYRPTDSERGLLVARQRGHLADVHTLFPATTRPARPDDLVAGRVVTRAIRSPQAVRRFLDDPVPRPQPLRPLAVLGVDAQRVG